MATNLVAVRRRMAAEDRRMRAAEMFAAGVAQAEVARRLGVSAQAVNKWYHRWRQVGVEGLRARPPGASCRLSADEQEELRRVLKAGPAASGVSGGWTLQKVADLIQARFNVVYRYAGGLWKLLHRLGFTAQMPASRATQRDEAAIAEFRTKGWVMIVKRPGPAGRGSSSPTSRVSV